MFAPKNRCVVIIQIPCIVKLKCKIILIITSTYITSIICINVGFLAGAISLKVAYSITTVALDVRGVTGGCHGGGRYSRCYTLQNKCLTCLRGRGKIQKVMIWMGLSLVYEV
jgi:hypothetical protein